jgi:lipooligosaccharide transport system ATP-binding protein
MAIAISAEHISKSYGSLKAVSDISFTIEEAACFGFLGPNGAGKSTLMKTLYNRVTRDKNEGSSLNVLGYDPGRDEVSVKFLTGIVPQEDNLDVELTVENNLFIYSKFYGMKKEKAAQRIDYLLDFMDLTDKKKAPIKALSGGMKRRLIIARALINEPKLLILDEPTTGLDPQVRHHIWDRLRLLRSQGVTILLTTHYMEEAYQICDTIIIMDKGHNVLEGTPQELISNSIETFVLELNTPQEVPSLPSSVRAEYTHTRGLLYSDTLTDLEEIRKSRAPGECYIRQSNLEDVFMKTTGRQLHD